MPSLREKIAGLLRQLPTTDNKTPQGPPPAAAPTPKEESFVQKHLNGSSRRTSQHQQPEIVFGKCCYDLPMRQVARLSRTVLAAHTGPEGGLASVNRRHQPLEYLDLDVDFIDGEGCDPLDTPEEVVQPPKDAKMADPTTTDCPDEIAGIKNWNSPDDRAFGLATSLYEKHPTTKASAGEPLADAFAVCLRENSAVLALADGVNWGTKSCLAARCAVHGCIDYLNNALYSGRLETTMDVFVCLLRSFHAAHNLILQEEGSLTTLCAAVVCPLRNSDKAVVCACNVGDSLAYIYSRKHGVREITQGSHDIHSMRDMRDALGALGPVDGVNPELSNLTVSMTTAERGDIVFLCSDGVSDNFDPVVGKFALPRRTTDTTDNKRNNNNNGGGQKTTKKSSRRNTRCSNAENTNKEEAPPAPRLPVVEAHQRHQLTLLRMEEELLNSSNSNDNPSARRLCESLVGFAERLTVPKRRILEDPSLYGTEPDSQQEQRLRRRRVAERLYTAPGKLDHATVVACRVGDYRVKSPARRHRSKSPRAASKSRNQNNNASKVSRGMKTEPCNLESSI